MWRRVKHRWRGQTAAFAGEASAVAPVVAIASVAAILSGHVLRDGEEILLILKPSRWSVAMSCFAFAASVAIVLCIMQLVHAPQFHYYADAALLALATRVMWAILNWMGRLYVLTNQRIMRLSGILTIEVDDCPLRKVRCVSLVRSPGERLLHLGTIDVDPVDDARRPFAWQTIPEPQPVLEQIQIALRRAKQG